MFVFIVGLLESAVEMLAASVWLFIAWYICLCTLSIALHELGHLLVARWCGVRTEVFRVGAGPSIQWVSSSGVVFRVGIVPMSGRVTYSNSWHHIQPLARAAISSGGWLADVVVLLGLLLLDVVSGYGPAPVKLALLIGMVQVFVGLTPLTGDGRAIAGHLRDWASARRV